MPNNRRTKRVSQPRGNQSGFNRIMLPGPASPSTGAQKIYKHTLAGASTLLNTQSTTGLFNIGYLTPSLSTLKKVVNWKSVYDEWRLVGVDFHIAAIQQQNGVSHFVVDDEDNTMENADWFEARGDRRVLLNNSASPLSSTVIKYRSQDLSDLTWKSTYSESTYTPCALKFYTSLTEYGTPASITGLYYIYWVGHFEFRGIGANN